MLCIQVLVYCRKRFLSTVVDIGNIYKYDKVLLSGNLWNEVRIIIRKMINYVYNSIRIILVFIE